MRGLLAIGISQCCFVDLLIDLTIPGKKTLRKTRLGQWAWFKEAKGVDAVCVCVCVCV